MKTLTFKEQVMAESVRYYLLGTLTEAECQTLAQAFKLQPAVLNAKRWQRNNCEIQVGIGEGISCDASVYKEVRSTVLDIGYGLFIPPTKDQTL